VHDASSKVVGIVPLLRRIEFIEINRQIGVKSRERSDSLLGFFLVPEIFQSSAYLDLGEV
jgi:hypothetical protein